jgi:hypothetical protein
MLQVSHVGPNLCFLLDAATYTVAAWCAHSLKGMLPEEAAAMKEVGLARQRMAANSPLKSAAELAAVQPAKLEALAAPEVLQSSVRILQTRMALSLCACAAILSPAWAGC